MDTGELRFERLALSPQRRELRIDGSPVALGSRAFDVLVALVERRDRVVTKAELLDLAWPGLVVEENNLQVQISTLRKLLGPHAIATVPGRGYQFTAPPEGDESAPPPAARPIDHAAARRTGNLQAAPELFGRDQDLDALCALVREHRTVSVVGAGGIGKTRLALAAAHRLHPDFEDGAWFVELAPLSDPAVIGAAVVRELGLSLSGRLSMADEIAAALQGRRMLLVLDNCEHLLDGAAALVQTLVDRAPSLHVVVTTQELLRLPSERVFRLPPLAVPKAGDLEGARHSGAVELFIARVAAQQPRFEPTHAHMADVVEICRRLDGLPLAIELAAARAAQLGVVVVRERLAERFRVLTGGSRLALRRHQTLREMLDWSHGLLEDDVAVVFQRSGVFAGGFTLAAAQEVLADDRIDGWAVLEHVAALVDKSLVVADPGEPPRYRLLESMRAYALEKLRDSGETDALLLRHAQWMRSVLEAFDEQEWSTPTQVRLAHAVPEIDNLRAALDWSEQTDGQHELQMSLAAHSRWLWMRVGLRPEGLRRLDAAMARLDGSTPPRLAAAVKSNWANLSYPDAGVPQRQAAQDAVDLCRALGDRRALFRALAVQGRVTSITADVHVCAQAAREMARVHDPAWPEISRWHLLNTQMLVPYYEGRPAEAIPDATEAMHIAQRGGDAILTCVSLLYLEQAAQALGRWEEALERGRELIALKKRLRFGGHTHNELNNLAMALTRLGRLDEALEAARQSVPDHIAGGTTWLILDLMALLTARRGHWRAAALAAGRSEAAAMRTGGVREPNEARAFEDATSALRAELPGDELARLLERGAAMTDEAVVQLALADADAP